jgi:hypothetical protein
VGDTVSFHEPNNTSDVNDLPLERMTFEDGYCFLCGNELDDKGTLEHVFPKWLQRKYNLWNQKLTILNGTKIQYKNITIPCCAECNNQHLSKLESEFSNALFKGFESFLNLDKLVVYQWVAKIIYGLMRKQLSLHLDRKDLSKGTILTRDFLEGFRNIHALLQSLRQDFTFSTGFPFSVFTIPLHAIKEFDEYDFADNLCGMTVMFRLKEIGIIVALQDLGNHQVVANNVLKNSNGKKFHPIQLIEMFARVTHKCTRRQGSPTFGYLFNKNTKRVDFNILSRGGVEKDWDNEMYFKLFKFHLQNYSNIAETVESVQPNLVSSFLLDEYENDIFMDENGKRVE